MSKRWSFSEEQVLIDNYTICTIFELSKMLPGRDADSINCKIKRLRKQNKIIGHKTDEAVARAYKQK